MPFDLSDKIKFIRERTVMEQKMEEKQEAKLVDEVKKQEDTTPEVEMPVEAPQEPLEAQKEEEPSSCACLDEKALKKALKPLTDKMSKLDAIYDGLVELGVIKETKKKGKK